MHRGRRPLMNPGSRNVAVVGVALSDCGRVDEATPYALHAQAARRALADAGLAPAAVDGLASAGLGTLAPAEVAEYLGLRPRWVDSTSVGGSTWEVMAAHAADAIAAGHARAVLLVYGSTARADVKAGRRTSNLSFGARGPLQFEVPYGHTLVAKHAMAARRHMHEHGTTLEQLADIAVQARADAAHHGRRRAARAGDRRPLRQTALLHPLRRRRRGAAAGRGPRRGHGPAPGVGAGLGHRRLPLRHVGVGRLHRLARGGLRARRVRAGGGAAVGDRCGGAVR